MNPAYYNEFDPFAADWLRNLIAAGLIAPGDVDERSIEDVHPDDLRNYTQCHFFAGIGVWSYALRAAGWPDDRPVWTGSCPCQPFSAAGKGAGFDDERHLWPAWRWLIQQRKPAEILGEQVPDAIKHGWIDLVGADLEASGYAFAPVCFAAGSAGEPIRRKRIYFLAQHLSQGRKGLVTGADTCPPRSGRWGGQADLRAIADAPFVANDRWPQPLLRSLDYGVAGRVEQLRAYGNAINAEAAITFIKASMK